MNTPPAISQQSVLVESEQLPADTPQATGYDFNKGIDLDRLLESYATTGFQSTLLSQAIDQINKMLYYRDTDTNSKCTIFLGYTSNLVSSGLRDVIRYLVQHSLVDVIVTTAGGVEEDLIKCLAPTYISTFDQPGKQLRKRGLNRIGNLIVPNDNYCKFEDWVIPILDQLLVEQQEQNTLWSPSKIIQRLGKEINDTSSIAYWAYKNNIPIYSPALTDGSLGDMIYFHSYRNPGLIIDIASDIRAVNSHSVFANKTGMVILGGGIVKHHICNANLMRNGADWTVFVNTAQEFDGSDAGARPDEAVSWGKIRAEGEAIKVCADATIVFPLIVAGSFAKYVQEKESKKAVK